MSTWLATMSIVATTLTWFSAAHAQPADLQEYTLFGATEVRLGSGAVVEGAGVGTNAVAQLKGGRVAADAFLVADEVRARTGSSVAGALFANRIDAPGGVVQGPVLPATIPVLTLPPPPTVTPGTVKLVVFSGFVDAGAYDTIDVAD